MKAFKEIERISDRQDGRVRELMVDREPGAPKSGERVLVENMGECYVHSCQPAGRDHWRLVVRRA